MGKAMNYFIKGIAFKTKFEFQCELGVTDCLNTATLRVYFNKDSWKENTLVSIKHETLQEIINTLIQADQYQIDASVERGYTSYEDLKNREKSYNNSYKYYIEKFVPIENMFF